MKLKDKNLYYVGGIVRDELLGIGNLDTDYCYEGDAIEFARSNGLNIVKENPAFGTVRIEFENESIDIASTRIEIYPNKGHLPVVLKIGCSLEEDVMRRDFTINALYKRTTDGEIIDFTGGINDIKEGCIKVLHDESFIDDPTRIMRALKFSVRFGFELDERTEQLQNNYLENINYDMSYHRLKKEIIETFNLNKFDAYIKFVDKGIYKLLGANQTVLHLNSSIEEKCLSTSQWLKYVAFFNLENLELTRSEKRIIDWVERLKSEKPTNNTPKDAIILDYIRKECT